MPGAVLLLAKLLDITGGHIVAPLMITLAVVAVVVLGLLPGSPQRPR